MEATTEISLDAKTVSENIMKDFPKNILYLGLEISETSEWVDKFILDSLRQLYEEFKIYDVSKLISLLEEKTFELPENYKNTWKYPKDSKRWHITTMFKKGKSFVKSHPACSSFVNDKEIEVQLRGLLYVPYKIMTSIVYTETPVQNDFPHMTTLLGSYAAKNSNDLCQELFSNGKPFEKEYKSLMKCEIDNSENVIHKVQIKLFNKEEAVYFITFNTPIIVQTQMKMFSS